MYLRYRNRCNFRRYTGLFAYLVYAVRIPSSNRYDAVLTKNFKIENINEYIVRKYVLRYYVYCTRTNYTNINTRRVKPFTNNNRSSVVDSGKQIWPVSYYYESTLSMCIYYFFFTIQPFFF